MGFGMTEGLVSGRAAEFQARAARPPRWRRTHRSVGPVAARPDGMRIRVGVVLVEAGLRLMVPTARS
jgi:hypothetical protein